MISYLNLFNVILDPFDGVSVDVIASVDLLPSDQFCSDNLQKKNTEKSSSCHRVLLFAHIEHGLISHNTLNV